MENLESLPGLTYETLQKIAKKGGKIRWARSNITEKLFLKGDQVWASKEKGEAHPIQNRCRAYYCREEVQ